jgi:drug/metabolite transporter (DMT)-like permease
MALSGAVVLHNKYLLSTFNFHFPGIMTMMHMGYSFILSAILIKVFKVCELPALTAQQFLMNIMPVAALYAIMLTCSNYSYMYLSVAFIQMLKASLPVLVFTVSVIAGLMSFDYKILTSILVICFGIFFVTTGEVQLHWVGFFLQVTALIVEANRLCLIEILLKKKGITLNPLTTTFYVAPATCLCLFVGVMIFEVKEISTVVGMISASPLTFVLNCSLAFLLNLAVFLIIGNTSALTMNIAGIAKDVVVITASTFLYTTVLSGRSISGFVLAVIGVSCYNYFKFRLMQQAANAKHQALEDTENPKGTSPSQR